MLQRLKSRDRGLLILSETKLDSRTLASIVAAGADYGNLPARGGEKIQLEYVSANPTGPLHVGHGVVLR